MIRAYVETDALRHPNVWPSHKASVQRNDDTNTPDLHTTTCT